MTLHDLLLRYEGVVRPLLRLASVVGGGAVLAWRMRETRVPRSWAIAAFLCGLLVFSWPLVHRSRFYLLALGMIVRWRADMYRQYRRLAPAA